MAIQNFVADDHLQTEKQRAAFMKAICVDVTHPSFFKGYIRGVEAVKIYNNVMPSGPELTRAGIVKFGSTIRLQHKPSYWPGWVCSRSIEDKRWLLTTEYFRKDKKKGDPSQLLITDINTGLCQGIVPDEQVEIIHKRGELMKISEGQCGAIYSTLDDVEAGEPFRFKACLAQKHKRDNVFIRADICSSYSPGDYRGHNKYSGRIPVVNIRTGALAYVEKLRQIYQVEAEVCVAS